MASTPTVTIRATVETREVLNQMARDDGVSLPDLLGQLVVRERERRLLHEGLAALATMDGGTRDAYLGEWQDWDDAPLSEPTA